jgi:hypothetical protein
MVAYLRYLDTFAKIDGTWLFAERLLHVDWLEERAMGDHLHCRASQPVQSLHILRLLARRSPRRGAF